MSALAPHTHTYVRENRILVKVSQKVICYLPDSVVLCFPETEAPRNRPLTTNPLTQLMSATPHTTTHQPLTTTHATLRLAERFPEINHSVETLWTDGVTAELPDKDFDGARYYPPADIVIGRTGNALVTVLDATATRVRTPGAVQCPECEQPHEAALLDTCPWCGTATVEGRTTGAITVRYTEDR